jgi:HEAT repeat protein
LAALDRIAGLKAVTPVAELSEILKKTDDPGIRLSAIRALAVQKNDSVVAVLLEAAEAATDPAIRTAAVTGLKSLGTPKAHDALKALEEE